MQHSHSECLTRIGNQAVARRRHTACSVLRRQVAPPTSRHAGMQVSKVFPEPVVWSLTDTEWEGVRLLLSSQKPPSGCPRCDHRTVLGGMLWVLGPTLHGGILHKRSWGLGRQSTAATVSRAKRVAGSA
jgi:hypothetical protein